MLTLHRFYATARALLPSLLAWWDCIKEGNLSLSSELRASLIEASLAASKLSHPRCRTESVPFAKGLLTDDHPPHLRISIARAEGLLLRMAGRVKESENVLQEAITSLHASDTLSQCLIKQLYLSRVENAFQENRFEEAGVWLEKVTLEHESRQRMPAMELQLLRLKHTVTGRLMQYIGCFEAAEQSFEMCLTICEHASKDAVCHIVRHIADVRCELGRPDDAQALLEPYIRELRASHRQNTRAYRRLALPLAEALLLNKRYSEAQSVLHEVHGIFRNLDRRDQTDELDHVRSSIGLMRIARASESWDLVLEIATDALQMTEKYASFSSSNFYKGCILRFRAVAQLESALQDVNAAARCVQIRRHFMAGIGTYEQRTLDEWHQEAASSIKSNAFA